VCYPTKTTAVVTGGSGLTIAIVDAFHNPNVTSDLATFAQQFGMTATPPNLQVVYATGRKPPTDRTGWSLESSLDVEWAYAMSPNAKIILVEAASDYSGDLLLAVDVASNLVSKAGGGLVSMSWGGSEFLGQTTYDSHFRTANVTYIASSGDAPGVSWPSSSAYVISAGGTSISRDPASGNFQGEMTWQQAGSGISQYVTRPSYQKSLSIAGNYRAVPDIAAVADPDTGVWVYAQYACTYFYNCGGTYWLPVGGTSAAAPIEAGIMSHKGVQSSGVQSGLGTIYNSGVITFRDITVGNCGPYAGYLARSGWDLCSGRGSLLAH
jgi:kumamolisin